MQLSTNLISYLPMFALDVLLFLLIFLLIVLYKLNNKISRYHHIVMHNIMEIKLFLFQNDKESFDKIKETLLEINKDF